MTKVEAQADVFLTALKALPKPDRDAVLVRIASDRGLGRDIRDLAVIAGRKDEPSRSVRKYMAKRKRR